MQKLSGIAKFMQEVFDVKSIIVRMVIIESAPLFFWKGTSFSSHFHIPFKNIKSINWVTYHCRITTRSTTRTGNQPKKPCVHSAPVYILRWTNSQWHHFYFHGKVCKVYTLLPVQASLSLSDNHRKCRTRSKRFTKTWALGGRAEEDVEEKDIFLGLSLGWYCDFVNGFVILLMVLWFC